VDEIEDRTLWRRALEGLVADLDPYTEILDPDEYQAYGKQVRGRRGGIGAQLTTHQGRLHVTRVFEGGPAARAGVRVGDLLLAVDERPVRGRPLGESLEAIEGQPGSTVLLELRQPGEKSRSVTIERQLVSVPSVNAQMAEPGIAHLEITHFHERTDQDFRQALEGLEAEAGGLRGVVVDLRGNFGGLIGPAIRIADGFLDGGLVLTTGGRTTHSRLRYEAQPGQWLSGLPLAVIIDRASASASEILAGALQDHERAVLVGETSFGKGSVQSVVELHDGSALKLTTARYYTPSGRMIEGSGIRPDRVVEAVADPGDDPADLALETAIDSLGLRPTG
jgi:carboxyl-terminal processing protease